MPSIETGCPTTSHSLYLDDTNVGFDFNITNSTLQTTQTQKEKRTTNTFDNCAALTPLILPLIQRSKRLNAYPA